MSTLVKNFNRQAVGNELDAGSFVALTRDESATLYRTLDADHGADGLGGPLLSRDLGRDDLVAAAQALLGVDLVDVGDEAELLADVLRADLEQDAARQLAFRQQAAAAGDLDALAGGLMAGSAASVVQGRLLEEQESKKAKASEFELMVMRVREMERQLEERIALVNELADVLEEEAAKDFEESVEAFAIGERGRDCARRMRKRIAENGDITAEDRMEGLEIIYDSCRVQSKEPPANIENANTEDFVVLVEEYGQGSIGHGELKHDDGLEKLEAVELLREVEHELEEVRERVKGMSLDEAYEDDEAYEEYKKVFDKVEDLGVIRDALERVQDKEKVAYFLDKYDIDLNKNTPSLERVASAEFSGLKPSNNDGMW